MTNPNPESVLDSIKKVLGFTPDFTDFDLDIIMHTNTAFVTLQQMGAGPSTGFVIIDNSLTWNDFSSSMTLLANVKTFIFLNVRMVFDPPEGRFVVDSWEKNIQELGWRITEMAQEISDTAGDATVQAAFWWDLTGLTDFPDDAAIGDLGIDMSNGDVWRKTLWAEFFWATSRDLQDRPGLKDPRVRRAPRDRQDQQAPKATRAIRVRLELPELRA